MIIKNVGNLEEDKRIKAICRVFGVSTADFKIFHNKEGTHAYISSYYLEY